MSVKQRLAGGRKLLSKLEFPLLVLGVGYAAMLSLGTGYNVGTEGVTMDAWSLLVGAPVAIAGASTLVVLWKDEPVSYWFLIRWTIASWFLVMLLPATAAALMTAAPSALTASMMFGSLSGPFLFLMELNYDLPVLTPFLEDGRLAWEVSA